jgi:peptide/nickel transport system substrate-binding protein
MATFDWHAHTDPDNLYFFFHSPGPRGIGAVFTGWSNRRFDELVERATTLGAQERKPVLHDAQRIMAEEVPLLTFWYRESVAAHRPAAYAGWVEDSGHPLLTKRSFLRPYAQVAEAGGPGVATDDGGGALWIVLVVGVGVVALAIGVVVMRRRRSEAEGFE